MIGHLGDTQSGLLEIWVLVTRSFRNWTQNETNGTSSGRIIGKNDKKTIQKIVIQKIFSLANIVTNWDQL